MNVFFSIIYLTLNASLKDKVSIGIIMSNGEDVKFRFSDKKLAIVKQLIPSQSYQFLKSYFKSLHKDFSKDFNSKEVGIFKKDKDASWASESYFSYLSRYANNIVEFSAAKKIDIQFDEASFSKIFEKYIFKSEESVNYTALEEKIEKVVKQKLYSKIESKVNLDALIEPKDFTELISPVDINFIGENGQFVSGQTIDFSKRYVDLEHDLTKYISFTKAVDFQKKKSGHYFLIGMEPSKHLNSKNHYIWKNIFDSNMVDYVAVDETDKIKEYIYKNDVRPYFVKSAGE